MNKNVAQMLEHKIGITTFWKTDTKMNIVYCIRDWKWILSIWEIKLKFELELLAHILISDKGKCADFPLCNKGNFTYCQW